MIDKNLELFLKDVNDADKRTTITACLKLTKRYKEQSVLAWGKYHTVVRENNALRKRNYNLEKEVLEIVS